MRLRRIGRQIHTTQFLQPLPGGIRFPTRMTVLEATPGELVLHSPIPIDQTLKSEIESLGEVRWIIAPNDFHHLHLPAAAKLFPAAEVWGTSGAIRKRDDVAFVGDILVEQVPLPESIVPLRIDGADALSETVFWLPDDDALLCSDLVFNMHDPATWMTKLVLKLVVGSSDEPRQSRSFRWFFVKNRHAFAESLRDVLSRDFQTLIMAHGDVVEEGGAQALRKAADWIIDDTKRIVA